jgi:hypothetical protein
MTLFEAIKSGKCHRRKNDNFVYFVPMVGGIGYSQDDVLANDWEIVERPRKPVVKDNVVDMEATKIKVANRKRKPKK